MIVGEMIECSRYYGGIGGSNRCNIWGEIIGKEEGGK